MSVIAFFQPDARYEGVRPFNIHLLRLFFLLMFLFVGFDSWTTLLGHQGPWDHVRAVAWCMFASYSLLSIIGVFRPLKMLPIFLFMILYKSLWLIVVAYPLWSEGQLAGSPAEGMASIFVWVAIPIVITPWRYVLDTYILNRATR
jgi:hypothetical protein